MTTSKKRADPNIRNGCRLKKGSAETTMMTALVGALIIAVVLFILIKNSAVINVDVTAKDTCKRSVQQYAKLKLPGVDLSDSDMIRCPTRTITINPSDEDNARKGIAKAMFDCFDQFGADKLELFDTRRGSTDNYCIVCSKIDFTKKGTINGMADYLTNNNPPGFKETYLQYFTGQANPETEEKSLEKVTPFDSLDVSKPHAVIFTYAKTTGWWDKLTAGSIAGVTGLVAGVALVGVATGGVGWLAIGGGAIIGSSTLLTAVVHAPNLKSEWSAGVILTPYDDSLRQNLGCMEIPIRQ